MSTTNTDTESDRTATFESYPLGTIDPARSRHMWTRSAVHVDGDLVVAGQWNGTVTAFDAPETEPGSLECRWTVDHPDHAVGITTLPGEDAAETGTDDAVIVAGRGKTGTIAAYDAATGDRRWSYDTVDDVGEHVQDSIFYLPYVVALESAGADADPMLYAAARRYERDGETRQWHSVVLAFDADGTVRWRYETDASPIAIDLAEDGTRLAVGYNRCMGDHDTGLVMLEAETGDLAWTWDPGTEGDRRVGDVAIDGETVAVASHGDKRGYLLGPGGAERWAVDLATETDIEGETLYAYPNHAAASDGRATFVTGNTYAIKSRETENRHPNEHRIATFDGAGNQLWDTAVRGFVHGLATDGDRIAAPCAQNFRVRDPDTHAVRWFDRDSGQDGCERLESVATAVAVDGETIAAIEEPVAYHDDGRIRGEYALRVGSLE
ncbi:transcriptional regulator [Salinadaptatus halalkaliphilus]|uniref:Transcriptional regulator n=1 Tax=Salinadaptatus halalkaliphilus TaxID=2419781 RepID=A0A4S3TLB2_9EURY|nr:PQQ-binding-like beta-propeller repeat protein [Salinadaptatus halalkaliphilus]THE64390.1 transcriptional regulator [Salinadaptatus halalkaliphilus]